MLRRLLENLLCRTIHLQHYFHQYMAPHLPHVLHHYLLLLAHPHYILSESTIMSKLKHLTSFLQFLLLPNNLISKKTLELNY